MMRTWKKANGERLHPGVAIGYVESELGRYKNHLDDIRCDILDTGFPLGDDSDQELTPRKLVRRLLEENAALKRELAEARVLIRGQLPR
jgi:hypothetical protein